MGYETNEKNIQTDYRYLTFVLKIAQNMTDQYTKLNIVIDKRTNTQIFTYYISK